MVKTDAFRGFSPQCVKFYEELPRNNNKEWFTARKSDFDEHVMGAAIAFVPEMGRRLQEIAPRIIADPRLDKSIFRHYRDTRFSKDKSPYKTHMGIYFWEGKGPKMECPGFYFHLQPPFLMLGAGIYCFSKPLMDLYRDSVVHPIHGANLKEAIEQVKSTGNYEVGIKHFKKTPRGYDPKHENAELLLYNGLTAATSGPAPNELYSADIVDYCFDRFRDMAPIQKWLLDMIGRRS